jgi:hypothetical protein
MRSGMPSMTGCSDRYDGRPCSFSFPTGSGIGIHAHFRSRDDSSAPRIGCASLDQSPASGAPRHS